MDRKLFTGVLAVVVALGMGVALAGEEKNAVVGDYIEARTCDVWTGPCFSNAEINLTGNHAVMAWSVRKGEWDGMGLDGLKIVAALTAEGTFHTNAEGEVKAEVFVDRNASCGQRKALLLMARQLAPKYLKNIVKVRKAPISFERKGAEALLKVGSEEIVKLQTTALNPHCDIVCGNEEKAYPSLSSSTTVDCAKTVTNSYVGQALDGARWNDINTRSAMIGTFAR